jgi:phosphohistidine swiveling domain-containing protein
MQIEKKKFIIKYGHLRPNTYNINSEKYADLNLEEIIRNSKIKKNKPKYFNFSKSIILKIQKIFKKDKFDYDSTNIVSLLKIGIRNREYTKFIFSKVLSEVLDLLKEYSLKNKFKLNEFCNLELKTILNENNKYELRKKINIQNKLNYFNNVLLLPDVIIQPNNIYNFTIFETKGNFVTEIKINSKIYYLDNNINDAKLNNKIIIIESADPGYDWIFGHRINGLITKYGGANSHMTIRCAELNIPAAIGVGEDIFNNVKKSVRITLDCKNQKIIYD